MSERSGVLLAVLLNPPGITSGTRTLRAVERAAAVLGFESATIANLCGLPTPTVVELNRDPDGQGWLEARAELVTALSRASGVLAAWGVSGLTGSTRAAREAQVEFLRAQALAAGVEQFWTLGGEPRHPSRWHQFLADKHGRTAGGTFEDRLTQALVPVSLLAGKGDAHG